MQINRSPLRRGQRQRLRVFVASRVVVAALCALELLHVFLCGGNSDLYDDERERRRAAAAEQGGRESTMTNCCTGAVDLRERVRHSVCVVVKGCGGWWWGVKVNMMMRKRPRRAPSHAEPRSPRAFKALARCRLSLSFRWVLTVVTHHSTTKTLPTTRVLPAPVRSHAPAAPAPLLAMLLLATELSVSPPPAPAAPLPAAPTAAFFFPSSPSPAAVAAVTAAAHAGP